MTRPAAGPLWPLVAAALLPLAAVGMALYTQHGLGMQPCPWCVLQRLIDLGIASTALGALVGRFIRLPPLSQGMAGLALLLALCGAAAALWQHLVAASSTSCVQTLADRIVQGSGLAEAWPEVFAAYASCADAAVKLFGVPYEFYSLALFALLAGLMGPQLRARGGRG